MFKPGKGATSTAARNAVSAAAIPVFGIVDTFPEEDRCSGLGPVADRLCARHTIPVLRTLEKISNIREKLGKKRQDDAREDKARPGEIECGSRRTQEFQSRIPFTYVVVCENNSHQELRVPLRQLDGTSIPAFRNANRNYEMPGNWNDNFE